jgi:hypothetical protein
LEDKEVNVNKEEPTEKLLKEFKRDCLIAKIICAMLALLGFFISGYGIYLHITFRNLFKNL